MSILNWEQIFLKKKLLIKILEGFEIKKITKGSRRDNRDGSLFDQPQNDNDAI